MPDPRPSLLDRLFGREGSAPQAPQEKAGLGVTFVGPDTAHTVDILSPRPSYQADQLTRSLAFATSAYCYTAMVWRARRLAEAPLMVVRETEDGEEWQPGHPLAPLLEQPRPDIQMGEMLERTQMYRDLTGGALWVTDVDYAGQRRMVTPYSADEFRTQPLPPLIYGRYEVATTQGAWRPVNPAGLVHFRETNPASWRDTVSKVDAALLQLDLGHNVGRIVHNFLRKAMFPGGIISPDKDWQPSQEEWDTWKAQVSAWHSGPANQGLPLVVLGSTTFTPVTTGMSDLLPEAILDRVEATVGAVFGTPPVVLGWLSGMKNSPWSQMTDARRQVYEDTIAPLWGDVERRLTMAWLTPEERAAGLLVRFDTSKIPALQADQERQARIGALASDVLTVNERRLMLGQDALPPGDERGEEITGLMASAAPAFGLGAGDGPPPKEPAPPADPEDDADPEEDSPDSGIGKGEKATADTKDLLWLLFDLNTKASQPAWQRTIYVHLRELRAKILKAAERTLVAQKASGDILPSSGRSFQLALTDILDQDKPRLIAKTHPLLVSTGGAAVKRLGARIGLSFSVLEPGLLKYSAREANFLATVMGESTGTAVARVVQDSLNAGETIAALTKRLEDLPEFSQDRAKMVARTETTRAWNGSQREAMSNYQATSGTKATKSWLSARDARVRDEHVDLDDGSYIPIDATFDNGLTEPGEPNCRCTLLYALEDADTPLRGTQQ